MSCIARNKLYTKAFSYPRKIFTILANGPSNLGSQLVRNLIGMWSPEIFINGKGLIVKESHNSLYILRLSKRELKLNSEEFSHHITNWSLKTSMKKQLSNQGIQFTFPPHPPNIIALEYTLSLNWYCCCLGKSNQKTRKQALYVQLLFHIQVEQSSTNDSTSP